MYFLFGFLLMLCIFFCFFGHFRSRHMICKIRRMDSCEKLCLLNELISPFGFSYNSRQDIITALQDPWQREFGYHAAFDRTAPHFNMVFDCEPVYFDYDGRTWLIELWKGQYGINIGAEVGVYYADSVLAPDQYRHTFFKSVPDERMLPIAMDLHQKKSHLFAIQRLHWWLTGFCMGKYCEPEELTLNVSLIFPDAEMLASFINSLLKLGYRESDIFVCGLTVTFSFEGPHNNINANFSARLCSRIAQRKNRLFIRLYRWITRPFTCTSDRLLYLYYLLPFAFRHAVCCKKNRKQKLPKICKKNRCLQ